MSLNNSIPIIDLLHQWQILQATSVTHKIHEKKRSTKKVAFKTQNTREMELLIGVGKGKLIVYVKEFNDKKRTTIILQ